MVLKCTEVYMRWPQIKGVVVCMGGVSFSFFGFFLRLQKQWRHRRKIKPYCNSHGSGAGADIVQRTADNISLCILQHTCMYNNIYYTI